jgi:hypothetical protein
VIGQNRVGCEATEDRVHRQRRCGIVRTVGESRFRALISSKGISLYSQSLEFFITIIMRLPYIPDPPEFTEEADKAVLERIKERRGPKGLIALDRTLLHSPPVADGW